MAIIERLISKLKKQEQRIVTTHTLGKHILENKSVTTPIYIESRSFEKRISKTSGSTIRF